jgi:hypothetical protein
LYLCDVDRDGMTDLQPVAILIIIVIIVIIILMLMLYLYPDLNAVSLS